MAVLLEADGQVRLAGAVARVAEHLVQHQLFVDARLQSQHILITDQSVHPYGILHRFGVKRLAEASVGGYHEEGLRLLVSQPDQQQLAHRVLTEAQTHVKHMKLHIFKILLQSTHHLKHTV